MTDAYRRLSDRHGDSQRIDQRRYEYRFRMLIIVQQQMNNMEINELALFLPIKLIK